MTVLSHPSSIVPEGCVSEARYVVAEQVRYWQVRGVRSTEVAAAIGCRPRWPIITRNLARWFLAQRETMARAA